MGKYGASTKLNHNTVRFMGQDFSSNFRLFCRILAIEEVEILTVMEG